MLAGVSPWWQTYVIMRTSLDIYDDRPASMKRYLKYYGQHFNRKLNDFAVSKMNHGK